MRFLATLAAAALLPACATTAPLRAADKQAEEVLTHGQHPHQPLEDGGYAYQLFIPKPLAIDADGAEDQAAWPLMIFLHGSGSVGMTCPG